MHSFLQDVRYGLRILAKNPGFTLIAVLTLALGIGANTALFSVVNGVLLSPLPFPNPSELYAVYQTTATFGRGSVSYPNYEDWRKDNRSFASLGAYRSDEFNLTGYGEPERLHAHMISANLFSALGVPPLAGRGFQAEDDHIGSAPVAMLSDGLWKRKFASSRDVLGKNITLNGQSYTVIGVAPGRLPIFSPADVYVPLGQWADPTFRDRHIGMGTRAVGRLKAGVSFAQASADFDSVAANLAATYPDSDKGSGIAVVPLKTDVVGDVRGVLLVLLGAVSFVLLIACANVANLLLARSTGRTREFAVRSALGASPARVIRQLLTESVILSLAGGALGLLLAKWGTRLILAALPDALPRTEAIALDARVLLFALGVSVLTGIVFGLAPSLKTLRPDIHETLKEGGRGSSGSRHRTQRIFVAIEMALAVVLLIGAGLMIRSLAALWSINPGFEPNNALAFSISQTSAKSLEAAQLRAKYREMLSGLQSIPAVQDVSMIGGALPMTGDSELPFWREGQPKPASDNDMPFALFYLVTPGYQKAMNIPMERGRFFNDNDSEGRSPVAVIDASLARRFFPNEDPIGKRLNLGLLGIQAEIVGVIGHVEHWGLGSTAHQDLQSELYLSVWQTPDRFWPLLANGCGYIARTAGAPLDIANNIRAAADKVDSTAVVYEVHPMPEIVASSISTQRLTMLLLSVFSALALILSAIGIYGVISYLSAQRTHEIGVRVAMGASRKDVLRLVLGEGMRMTLLGVGIGIVAAFGLTRLIAKIIYGVSPSDPLTFIAVAVLLSAVALFACYIPARRAMRVDPMVALRYE
jgi:predicted permease